MMALKRRWSSVLIALVALLAVVILSGVIAGIGIRLAGSMDAFQDSLANAGLGLLLWRLTLYGGLGYYWWMHAKPRVLRQFNDSAAASIRVRMWRLERLAIVMLVVFEALNLLRWFGGY